MRHQRLFSQRLVLPGLILLLALALAGCGSTPATSPAPAPTHTPVPETQPAPTRTARPTSSPTLTARPTQPPSPTPSPTPSTTPTPSFTPTPSPPPISNPGTGEPLLLALDWQLSANDHLSQGAIVYDSETPRYLLTSLDQTLYAVEEGEVLWKVRTGGPVYTLALPLEDRVATGDDAGNVTLIHLSGRTIWRHNLGSRVTAVLAWQDGLLAGGWDERLTFLSLGGEVLWQTNLEGPVSKITTLNKLALVSTQDGKLGAFNASGEQVWRWSGTPVTALEVAGTGRQAVILAGAADGQLIALNADGTPRWQRTLAQGGGVPIWHAGDIAEDGALEIVAGTGGDEPILALLSADGDWQWRIAVPAPVGAITSVDMDGDGVQEILVGLGNSEIRAYDGQGRLRGSIRAGLAVWGLETPSRDETGLDPATPEAETAAGATTSPVLVRADTVAWQLTAAEGSHDDWWLSPPPLVEAPPETLPAGAAQADGPGEAILVFLGDVSLGRTVEQQLARYGSEYPWQGLHPLLHEADLAAANLESVLTTQGEPWKKRYLIRAHPQWGTTLVQAGFDLVTVANNHALDYEQVGLEETLDILDGLEIATVGGRRVGEDAHDPAMFDLNGLRVAVLGYAATRWYGSADMPATDRIAWAQPSVVAAEVGAVRDQADFVVVLLHAGTEYASEPSPDQVAVAHAATTAGADLVVGHHPHTTQTVEQNGGGLIVYSLGDGLFDIPRPEAMQGDLLRVHITGEGLAQAELWPFWIDQAIQPRLLDDGQGNPRFEIVYP